MGNAQSKQSFAIPKGLLLCVWVGLVVVIVSGLMLEDRFFAIEGKPVALLKSASRGVTFRAEDDVKWKTVGKSQGFFDGDRVSTGPGSSANVSFGEGRSVEMAQDTIIAISSIREATGNSFIINLIKGGIKPVVPDQAKHALVVMSGTSTFIVEPGEERGFAKPIGGSLHEFSAKEKFPIHSKRAESDRERFVLPVTFTAPALKELPPEEPEVLAVSAVAVPSATPVVTVQPTPVVTPKIKAKPSSTSTQTPVPTVAARPRVDMKQVMPVIVESSILPTYMTLNSLDDSAQSIDIKVDSSKLNGSSYRGFVQVQSGRIKKELPIQNGVAQFKLTDELLSRSQNEYLGPIPCVRLELNAGVKVESEGASQLSDKGIVTRICSLHDAKAKLPLKVGLASLQAPISDRKFFASNYRAGNYPIQLIVTQSSDYLKLLPYMRSSASFQISTGAALTETGTFSVDASKIVCQFGGSGFSPQIADKLMNILGHAFVFKGRRSAIQDVSALSLDAFKDWISKKTDEGKNVYIRAKATFVPVSRDFMNERKEVAEFVKKASGAIFLEKVEIIAFR